jgi:YbbR domain-containing protein
VLPVVETIRNLLRGLVRHPHYKLMAVLVSLSLWMWVQGQRDVPDRIMVAWELPKGIDAIEPLPETVVVGVVGSMAAIRRATRSKPRIPIDLTQTTEGAGTYRVDFSTFEVEGLPANLEVKTYSPTSVSLTLDTVGTVKARVKVATVGSPQRGYIIRDISVSPDIVELHGPLATIEALSVVSTEPIPVANLRHDRKLDVPLDLPAKVRARGSTIVEVSIDIEPETETRTFSKVPLRVWRHDGWATNPREVTVRLQGAAAELREINDREVAAYVYLPDAPTRLSYEVAFGAPEGARAKVIVPGTREVKVLDVEPARVKAYQR